MVSIKESGFCPCPRCEIPMSRVDHLGMKRDRQQRIKLVRKDNKDRQKAVARARRAIYEENHIVDGAYVNRQLFHNSLVPTSVGLISSLTSARF
jgi:hypothetical protein